MEEQPSEVISILPLRGVGGLVIKSSAAHDPKYHFFCSCCETTCRLKRAANKTKANLVFMMLGTRVKNKIKYFSITISNETSSSYIVRNNLMALILQVIHQKSIL